MTDALTITDDIIGKYVRLRNGDKAYVSGVIPDEIKKSLCSVPEIEKYDHFIGFWLDNGQWREWSWKRSGKFIDPGVGTLKGCKTDIMSFWEEEEPKCEDSGLRRSGG